MCENGRAEATAAVAAVSVVKCRRLMCAEIVQEFQRLFYKFVCVCVCVCLGV